LHPASDFVRSFFQAEQLALQLRSITLAEVQPYLPQSGSSAAPPTTLTLPLSASVHEALGQLDAHANPSFRLADQPQAITRGQLLAAFGQALG
jgi:osmoprotectant transport system ATP-binding protein